jgi:drug/metabolite transporter (DMT)-like permease
MTGKTVITYKRIRMAGHMTAALAAVSFARGFAVQKGDVSPVKTLIFAMLLAAWFVVIPLIPILSPMMPRTAFSEVRDKINKFMCEIFFPPIIIAVLLWMAVTTWRRDPREFTLRHVLREITNGTQKNGQQSD